MHWVIYGIVEPLYCVPEINNVIDARIKIKTLKKYSKMSTWRMAWNEVSY